MGITGGWSSQPFSSVCLRQRFLNSVRDGITTDDIIGGIIAFGLRFPDGYNAVTKD